MGAEGASFYAVGAVAVLVAAISKGGFGSGAAFAGAVILALVTPPDRALAKQRLLAEAGLVVREVRRDFCAYEGAESIGSRSDLWVLRVTPQTRAPAIPEGALYTRRAPQ